MIPAPSSQCPSLYFHRGTEREDVYAGWTPVTLENRSGCARLDGVSERRPCPVHLELPNATSFCAGDLHRPHNQGLLGWAVGCCQRARRPSWFTPLPIRRALDLPMS